MRLRSAAVAFVWIALFVIADQLSKYWIVRHMAEGAELPLLPCLSLLHTRNTGIAFSMLSSLGDTALIGITAVIIIFILWLLRQTDPRQKLARFGYLLIIGGAFGNLLDRARLHYVVDFILFHLGQWSFAVFNLADAFITCGAACILLSELLKAFTEKKKV